MPPKKKGSAGSSAAADKKAKRKLELELQKARLVAVQNASKEPNYLSVFAAFSTFDRNGLKAVIKDYTSATVLNAGPNKAADLFNWMFELTKRHMEDHYNKTRYPWSDFKKKDELHGEKARFLIAYAPPAEGSEPGAVGEPLAFVHYRFDEDENEEVLYCYEVQVEDKAQRKGLGKFLMQLLELIARKTLMRKIVLTIQMSNTQAFEFYSNALKYKRSSGSPVACFPMEAEEYGYDILEKSFTPPGKS